MRRQGVFGWSLVGEAGAVPGGHHGRGEVDLKFSGESVVAGGHEVEGGAVSPGSSSAGVNEAVLLGDSLATVGEGKFGGKRKFRFDKDFRQKWTLYL